MFSELHFVFTTTTGVLILINFIVFKSKVVVGARLLEKNFSICPFSDPLTDDKLL